MRRRAGGLLALPAVMLASASPALATLPGTAWLRVCSGSETRWAAIPIEPAPPQRDDRGQGLCAHATCPRENRIDRKARLPG